MMKNREQNEDNYEYRQKRNTPYVTCCTPIFGRRSEGPTELNTETIPPLPRRDFLDLQRFVGSSKKLFKRGVSVVWIPSPAYVSGQMTKQTEAGCFAHLCCYLLDPISISYCVIKVGWFWDGDQKQSWWIFERSHGVKTVNIIET